MRGKLALHLRHVGKRPVPARFKLARHQSVGRVRGIVLPEGPVSGIARRFEVATESVSHLIPPLSGLLGGGGGSSDGPRADNAKQRFLDRIIDAQSAEGDAVRTAIVHPGAAAAVTWDAMLRSSVPKRQLAAAALAADQASQQRIAMLGRPMMAAGGNVAANH